MLNVHLFYDPRHVNKLRAQDFRSFALAKKKKVGPLMTQGGDINAE